MLKCGITGSTRTLGKKVIQNLPLKFYQFKKDITNFNKGKTGLIKIILI